MSIRSSVARRPWIVALLGVLLVGVVVLATAGIWLPGLAKPRIEALASKALNRTTTVAELHLGLWRLGGPEVLVRQIRIAEPSGDGALLTVGQVLVQASWQSLVRLAPIVRRIEVVQPELSVVRETPERYSIQDLLDKFLNQPSTGAPPAAFSVANIVVDQGALRFDDRPATTLHTVKALRVQIPFISSLPVDQAVDVLPRVSAEVNGSPFSLEGKTRPFSDQKETSLEVRLARVDLLRYLPYLPTRLPVAVQSAVLDTDLEVVFSQPTKDKASVRIEGNAALSAVKVSDLQRSPLVAIEKLAFEGIDLQPLAQRAALKRVTLDGLETWVERKTVSGGFFEPVLSQLKPGEPSASGASASAPSAPAKPWTWSLDALALRNAKVHVKDAALTPTVLPKALDLTVAPIEATLGPLGSNAPGPGAMRLNARLSTGEDLSIDGTLQAAPLALAARIGLSKLALKSWWWAIQPHVNLDVLGGELDASIDMAFDTRLREPLSLGGAKLAASGVELRQAWDQRSLVALKAFSVDAGAIDLVQRSVRLDAVDAREARLLIERDRDGRLNLARIAKGQPSSPEVRPESDSAPAWTIDLKRLSFDQGRLRIRDSSARGEADLDIEALRLQATDLSTRPVASAKERGRIDLSARIGKAGSIKVSGPLALEPLGGQIDIDLRGFPVLVAQPYFTQYVNALVSGGSLSVQGRVGVEPTGIGFRGQMGLADFASVTKAGNEDLLKWKSLAIDDLSLRVAPFALSVREVTLTDFFSRLIISPQGRFNLQDVLVSDEANAAASPPTSGASAKPAAAVAEPAAIRIDRLALVNGTIDFTDLLIRPNYSANLTQMTGAITGLSAQTPGALELRGRIDNGGSLEVLGRVNPLGKDLFLDAKARARDIDLPRLTPYAHKYVGYGIEKGKLSVNLSYFIEQRQVKAENNIILDQLTFGERIESPTATKLPVLFAIGLLKDRNGVIDVSLPVSGSLDDPQFSVAGIVWKLVGNLIVKAVTSPFTLLASLAGSSDAELSQIEFAQGSSVLTDAARSKLQSLGKALADRPGLKLDLAGRIDPERDAQALERQALLRLVKAQKLKQTVKTGTDAGAIDAVEISDQEYPRYLAQAYRASDAPKPRSALGQAREASVLEMEALLLSAIRVDESALRNLANERAQRAKEFLIDQSRIEADRVFVVAPRLTPDGLKAGSSPMQVEMSLK